MSKYRIGMIGLDTSHSVIFTRIMNDPSFEHYIDGPAKVTIAYPGGSPDFPLSMNRVDGFTADLRDNYNIKIASSIEEVASQVDAIFLTSVDGRVHLEQFRAIAPFGKPVFIDKPLTLSSVEARQIFDIAEHHGIPCMSSSPRRYAHELISAVSNSDAGAVIGAESYAVLSFEATQPGWFWYGIHTVETLFTTLGTGCVSVQAVSVGHNEVITGVWSDGRVGIVRGNAQPNSSQGMLIHREKETSYINTASDGYGKYAELVRRIIDMIETKSAPIPAPETIEIIRFIEAANESRETGKVVYM